ncbi:MAG: InlB B-repeat-containing protein [bacterium]|nr:InlB B-repeat-containing protein [bacterium]
MKQLRTRVIAMMSAVLMLFSVLPSVQTFAAEESNEVGKYAWIGRAFGQSTDLNFKSTILPEKVGTQSAVEEKIIVKDGETEQEKDAVVIESRGGKIANSHDGLMFYYAEVPTSKNFKLSANLYINQLGPEEETGSNPSKQEACGIMVRDNVGPARKDPMEFGFEEITSASNIVANMFTAPDKKKGVQIISNVYDRNGVTVPYGNVGAVKTQTKIATLSSDLVTTYDRTPEDGKYNKDLFVSVTLERKDDGFVVSYTDQDGKTSSKTVNGADRVAVTDKDNMYVGFFASRNAKMTVTDIELSTSEANTKVDGFTAAAYASTFDVSSATTSSTSDYTVRLRSNYAGAVTIKQDGKVIEENGAAKAATFYEKKTTLTNDTTEFEVSYAVAGSDDVKTAKFTVTKNEAYANKDLYVAADGTSDGKGTKESPLDVKTALAYVSDGYTVYAKGGTYGALVMDETYTADAAKKKTLCALDGEKVVFSGTSQVDASNWNFKQLEFTGSSTTGFRLTGHSNTIELCKFYDNGDTGCQISGGSGTDPLNWPSNNTILNCESYNNVDSSRINADGFAAKLGVGEGNVFKGCISHNNADDGWDLYNKLEDGANFPVTIDSCVAYENGLPYEGETAAVGSIGNGFKLGGEGLPVNHVVKNCISYKNNMDGFTCNFNPGKITVTNCTSFDNARTNYIFRSNPYFAEEKQGIFTNNISFRTDANYTTNDFISGTVKNSFFFGIEEEGPKQTITTKDFASVDVPESWTRDSKGNLNYGDFLRVNATSELATAGSNGLYVGALTPQWAIIGDTAIHYYTVKYDANGGQCSVASDRVKVFDEIEALPVPTRTGYTFKGWYTAKTGGIQVTKADLAKDSKDQTVYAQWTANQYKVTFNANGGKCNTSTMIYKTDETLKSLPTATKTGYTFNGWYTAKTGGTKVTAASIVKTAKNQTVYAQWTAKKSVVTLNANGGYIGNTKTKTVKTNVVYNGKYTLKTPKRAGYVFKGWYTAKTGGTKITSSSKVTVTKNTTLYAQWTKVTVSTSKVNTVKNVKTKKAVVTAKKVSGAAGYQVRYSTNKSLSGAKTVTSKSEKNITVKSLKKNSKYYVQVRAYKVDSTGKKVYGKWSATKTVTIKK